MNTTTHTRRTTRRLITRERARRLETLVRLGQPLTARQAHDLASWHRTRATHYRIATVLVLSTIPAAQIYGLVTR